MQKKILTAGQLDYEAKRAAKAGMSLEKYLASKERQAIEDAKAKAKAAEPPKPAKPPSMLSRLIDRAHEPLKKTTALSSSAKAIASSTKARSGRK